MKSVGSDQYSSSWHLIIPKSRTINFKLKLHPVSYNFSAEA